MDVAHARTGIPIPLEPGRDGRPGAVALVRDERLEVMRWMLSAGREVPEHLAYGPVTLQCLRGEVALRLPGAEHRLVAGAFVYLAAGERHALRALTDAVLLVTMVLAPPSAGGAPASPDGPGAPLHGERTGDGK